MYSEGYGVKRDLLSAVKWHRRSAEQGYAPAQYNLGVMYYRGDGVEKNLSLAEEWLSRAAVQGYIPAQQFLQ